MGGCTLCDWCRAALDRTSECKSVRACVRARVFFAARLCAPDACGRISCRPLRGRSCSVQHDAWCATHTGHVCGPGQRNMQPAAPRSRVSLAHAVKHGDRHARIDVHRCVLHAPHRSAAPFQAATGPNAGGPRSLSGSAPNSLGWFAVCVFRAKHELRLAAAPRAGRGRTATGVRGI